MELWRIIVIILMLLILSVMTIIVFNRGELLKSDPCSLCAKKMNRSFICMNKYNQGIIYNDNGSIENVRSNFLQGS